MTLEQAANALQSALSLREKASGLIATYAGAAGASAPIDSNVQEFAKSLATHITRADEGIAFVHSHARVVLDGCAQEEAALRREQQRLIEKLNDGKVTGDAANSANRRLTRDIEVCTARATTWRTLLDARTARDVGGFVDLPLDHYRVHAAAKSKHLSFAPFPSMPADSTRWLLFAGQIGVPFATALMIFLPWIANAETGAVETFYHAATISGRSLMRAWSLPGFSLWMAYFIFPLAAVPFASMSTDRMAGLGMILVAISGVLALALTLFTPLVFSDTGASSTWSIGVAGYASGFATQFLFGVLRLSPKRMRSPLSALAAVLSLATIAILLFGLVRHFGYPDYGNVSFQAEMSQRTTRVIEIAVTNRSTEPVSIYLPWPPGEFPLEAAGRAYGVRLYVAANDAKGFRVAESGGDVWKINQVTNRDLEPTTLAPGLTVRAELDLAHVVEELGEISVVKLSFTGSSGRVIREIELNFAGDAFAA